MKGYTILSLLTLTLVFTGCTKEVEIDIPGYEEQLVIDGRIETGMPPIVLISRSQDVYAPTDIQSFLNTFVSGAVVTVSDGTTTVVLEEICTNNLPAAYEETVSAMLGIPVSELANYTICAYASTNPAIWGQVGKTYSLSVEVDGETITGETTIVQPTPLDNLFWVPEDGSTTHGFSWATLSDPPNQFDAYNWQIKRINTDVNGDPIDDNFTNPYSPVFDDEFFDGLSFDFYYENPHAYGESIPEEEYWLYELGDTIVVKFSKLDFTTYEFLEKKYTQLATVGNPFATPTNIPNNLNGNALGIWAGYSPTYDTLYCQP
jgi:hypothetical protein